ncbi:PEP-utilizing enzyme [Desulfovibrio aminophilus]|nr:PEP-utilizing enzyme [Desulfovibrio aminophilus]MCM0753950.1 PEP-utilizing enzyme [Desulfovibrio aminophilus]
MVVLKTKADTLEALRGLLTRSRIPESVAFRVGTWRNGVDAVLDEISGSFGGRRLIARSSAVDEDGAEASLAGCFTSVGEIDGGDREAVRRAVEEVIASYGKNGSGDDAENQVLVQPMVTDISMSGVVFTQDLDSGAPYYVINYDDVSGRHDTITGGYGDVSRTLLVRRSRTDRLESPRFRALLAAVREIEDLVRAPGLDIEFALTRSGEVWILQVRNMACHVNWNRETTRRVDVAVEEVRRFLRDRLRPLPGSLGGRSLFGVMPDWNPAEMIGATPRRLAVSLYRDLITDSTWAEARAEMGYRDMSGRPLLFSLLGRPYIDVRESFNSFLPADLPGDIGSRLVDAWLDKLRDAPELHDKIEFEVAVTVHALDFEERARPELRRTGLGEADIDRFQGALLRLTNKAVAGNLLAAQLERVERLNRLRPRRLEALASGGTARLYAVKALLDDCRRLGTLPFSILARCAFMAEEMLRSLVRLGLVSKERAEAFRGSVRTVLTGFIEDVNALRAGRLSPEAFRERYGHLRPGTYDILSKRYDQRDYFGSAGTGGEEHRAGAGEFALSAGEAEAVDAALAARGFAFDAARLFAFMAEAIRGREYGKYCFTRNLSDALEGMAVWGEEHGLSREELSHLGLEDILAAVQESWPLEVEDELRRRSKHNRAALELSRAARLPFLIAEESDVDVIPLLKCRPNFITRKSVRAATLCVTGREMGQADLAGRIVLIESADPGFDWIFTGRIAGLVTKHGGSNSHMAIRCAELGLPAAIGCGEQLFQMFERAEQLHLDCGAEMVTVIATRKA